MTTGIYFSQCILIRDTCLFLKVCILNNEVVFCRRLIDVSYLILKEEFNRHLPLQNAAVEQIPGVPEHRHPARSSEATKH
jgi:hypothetical protein